MSDLLEEMISLSDMTEITETEGPGGTVRRQSRSLALTRVL
jgi:hypothetical protein